jgi:CheY-like chemotaxis protein
MNFGANMATILYIEDHQDLRETILAHLQYTFKKDTFVEASSYQEAVAAYHTHSPDVILSDFQYSGALDKGHANKHGSGGLDFFQYVADDHVPFAFLSGTPREDIQQALQERDNLCLPDTMIVMKSDIDRLHTVIKALKAMAAQRPGNPQPTTPPSELKS